jgi:hypothetical protein
VAVVVPWLSRADQQVWTVAWWGSTLLFAAMTVALRHPVWLFPTFASGIAAFLATGYVIDPEMQTSRSFATLAGLAWVFLGAAWAIEQRWPSPASAAPLTDSPPRHAGDDVGEADVRAAQRLGMADTSRTGPGVGDSSRIGPGVGSSSRPGPGEGDTLTTGCDRLLGSGGLR